MCFHQTGERDESHEVDWPQVPREGEFLVFKNREWRIRSVTYDVPSGFVRVKASR